MAINFYKCKSCGNVLFGTKEMHCHGEACEKLEANTVDASYEKHVPAVTVNGDRVSVQVGSVKHPMLPEHYIEWIALVQGDNISITYLQPGMEPVAEFVLAGEGKAQVYEYCNLHGLWVKEI